MKKCRLCRREAERGSSSLCVFHARARRVLLDGYRRWSEAYGGLSWKEYLNRIKGRVETGEWVKDVVAAATAADELEGRE